MCTGDGMVAVLSGVMRASGRQATGAALNIAGYWCIGVPLAYALGFWAGMGVLGLWIALAISTALQTVVFGVTVSMFDWSQEVARAAMLASFERQASTTLSEELLEEAASLAVAEPSATAGLLAPLLGASQTSQQQTAHGDVVL